MAKRSLKAAEAAIPKAKQAFERTGWTQEYLAAEVGLGTRQSIWKFFSGRPIERHLFIDICFHLDLDWEEIADLPGKGQSQAASVVKTDEGSEVDDSVVQLRSQLNDRIQSQCGVLQSSFDMAQPLQLDRIYTNVNILPHLTHQQWLEISDLQLSDTDQCQRSSLLQANQEAIPGMQVVGDRSKLVILGKPGAGKTTFLQHLALQCNAGKFKADCVPVFIQLRDLAAQTKTEDCSLLDYISNQWSRYDISKEKTETLLKAGRSLILLDGLDEVPEANSPTLLNQIDRFAQAYHQNQIVITCRIAAQQYHFRGFSYVELADFDQIQIEAFVKSWFAINSSHSENNGAEIAQQFLEQLQRRENQPIRELVATPILLSLVCSVFQARSTFPAKRSKLYQAGLDILLIRWDRARGIQRDQTYRKLSLSDKIKLLSQIAATTFERNDYFFEKDEAISHIADYLRCLPDTDADPESLWLNSEAVLKAIELQHGLLVERARDIYSFSHLTFQEYLTARKILASPTPDVLEESLQQLAKHVLEVRWWEVFSLTASMLPKADSLVLQAKHAIDTAIADDSKLQQFLATLAQKQQSLDLPDRPAAIRAFYFTLFQDRDLSLATALDIKLAHDLPADLSLDLALVRTLGISEKLARNPELKQILTLSFALDFDRTFELTDPFKQLFQDLKAQLPDLEQGKEKSLNWWKTNGEDWNQQLRSLIVKHRHIGHEWQWNAKQRQKLQQYYRSNRFLAECITRECQVTDAVRTEIETTLLQPAIEQPILEFKQLRHNLYKTQNLAATQSQTFASDDG